VAAEAGREQVPGPPRFFRRAEDGLVAHATRAFALQSRQSDGATLRDHLEARAARGVRSADLDVPPIPAGFGYLLDWFNELHRRRGVGPNGPSPLSWSDVDAWARRTDRDPCPWELAVIERLDDAYFGSLAGPEERTAPKAPVVHQPWPDAKGVA
jgi:hypothetical protein